MYSRGVHGDIDKRIGSMYVGSVLSSGKSLLTLSECALRVLAVALMKYRQTRDLCGVLPSTWLAIAIDQCPAHQ